MAENSNFVRLISGKYSFPLVPLAVFALQRFIRSRIADSADERDWPIPFNAPLTSIPLYHRFCLISWCTFRFSEVPLHVVVLVVPRLRSAAVPDSQSSRLSAFPIRTLMTDLLEDSKHQSGRIKAALPVPSSPAAPWVSETHSEGKQGGLGWANVRH